MPNVCLTKATHHTIQLFWCFIPLKTFPRTLSRQLGERGLVGIRIRTVQRREWKERKVQELVRAETRTRYVHLLKTELEVGHFGYLYRRGWGRSVGGSFSLHALGFVTLWRMFLSSTVAPNSRLPFSLFATYALLEKKKKETLRSIRGNGSWDGNHWVSGKEGGMLIAHHHPFLYPESLGAVHCRARGRPSTRFKNGNIKACYRGFPRLTQKRDPRREVVNFSGRLPPSTSIFLSCQDLGGNQTRWWHRRKTQHLSYEEERT